MKLHELQQKRREKEEEQWVKPQPCMICAKEIQGAYGHWGTLGWTCSAACERKQATKEKYPGHTEEDFFKRQGERDAVVLQGGTVQE